MNFRIQKVNWRWRTITKLLAVNEQVICLLRNWYWRPASPFVTAGTVVELHSVFSKTKSVCHAEIFQNKFCFQRIFCGLSTLLEIWNTNNTKVKLTCVVNYPPHSDDVLKCKVITERALSPIIIWKNANHQAKVKSWEINRAFHGVEFCFGPKVYLEEAKISCAPAVLNPDCLVILF
jgi:hypothetical protein